MLKPGERFIMPGDGREFEVLSVSFAGAQVRAITKRRVRFETKEGKHVGFDAPENTFTISANSIVEKIGREAE